MTPHNREYHAFFFILFHILGFYLSRSWYLAVVAFVLSRPRLTIPGFEAFDSAQQNWLRMVLTSRCHQPPGSNVHEFKLMVWEDTMEFLTSLCVRACVRVRARARVCACVSGFNFGCGALVTSGLSLFFSFCSRSVPSTRFPTL